MDGGGNFNIRRRGFLRSVGATGGLYGLSGAASGTSLVDRRIPGDDELVEPSHLWDEVLDHLTSELGEMIRSALKAGAIAISTLEDYFGSDSTVVDLLSKLYTLMENVPWVGERLDAAKEAAKDDDDDEDDGDDGDGGDEAAVREIDVGAGVPSSGSAAATSGAGASILPDGKVKFSVPDVKFDRSEINKFRTELEEQVEDVTLVDEVVGILDEYDWNPAKLLDEAVDQIRGYLTAPLPTIDTLKSGFEDLPGALDVDLLSRFSGESFTPSIRIPIDEWPTDPSDVPSYSQIKRQPTPNVGAGVGAGASAGAGAGAEVNSATAGSRRSDAVKPLKFFDCPGADSDVAAIPFEFGFGGSSDPEANFFLGLEPHANCAFMAMDADTNELLDTRDVLDVREETSEEVDEVIESYEDAIVALDEFFDRLVDDGTFNDAYEVTFGDLERTVTASTFIVDELMLELEELGYRDEIDFDGAAFGESALGVKETTISYEQRVAEFDPDVPDLSRALRNLDADADADSIDLAGLIATAQEFDEKLDELASADPSDARKVPVTRPREVEELAREIHSALDGLANDSAVDDATAEELDELREELREFVQAHEHDELDLTRRLEAELDSGFLDELDQLADLVDTGLADLAVDYIDKLPSVGCVKCCPTYRKLPVVTIGHLIWRAIKAGWNALKRFDSWLEDQLPVDGIWYRILQLLVVVLIVIALVFGGWAATIAKALGVAAKGLFVLTKSSLLRMFKNPAVIKTVIQRLAKEAAKHCHLGLGEKRSPSLSTSSPM